MGVCSITQSCPTLQPHGLQPDRLLRPQDSPGRNSRVGCHCLLQGIFLTQGSKPCLLHWQTDSLPLVHLWSPRDGRDASKAKKQKQKKNKDCWQHQKVLKEHGTDSFPEISVREWPCQFLDFGLLVSRNRINFYCCKPSSSWYFVTSATTWPPRINSEQKVEF